jgi:hypothetical protein
LIPLAEPLLERFSSEYSIISGADGAGLSIERNMKSITQR